MADPTMVTAADYETQHARPLIAALVDDARTLALFARAARLDTSAAILLSDVDAAIERVLNT